MEVPERKKETSKMRSLPSVPTTTRSRTYTCCAACRRVRIGRAAIGWPPDAALCPSCSDVARALLAVGVDRLSPSRAPQ